MKRELVVVNFAGGGGSCSGLDAALGFPPDHAVNHDPDALGMHRINHPDTLHHCEDVFEVNPFDLAKEAPLGLGWFSPDCRHFSKAKGGKPVSKKVRGLVLVMLKYAKAGMRVMMMENVEEIQTWGPLIQVWKKGKKGQKGKLEWHPDPAHKGRTWNAFLDCLGGGLAPDHPDLPEFIEILAGFVTREELVKGFGYKYEAREIRAFSHGAPTTRNRLFMIARNDGRDIVWPEATHGDPKKLQPGQKAWRTIAECIDWSEPCHSIFLSKKEAKKVGCKRPLVKNTLRRIATGVGRYMIHSDEPFIVPAFLTEHAQASNQRNMPLVEPMRTQCAGVKGGHFALVAASMVQTGYGEREGQAPRALDIQKPLGAIVAGGGKHGLYAANLVKMRGRNIGSAVDGPMHTASAGGNHHGPVVASLVRHFGESVGQELDKPGPTVMVGGGGKTGVLTAFVAQHNGGFNTVEGRPADAPLSPITTRGSQQQLVTASAVAYYGSEKDGQSMDEPTRTPTTNDRFGVIESTAVYPLTKDQLAGARRVAKFLRRFGIEFEGEFATVKGYVIVDLAMRMLTPRELFRAQGFRDDYQIETAWVLKNGTLREVKLSKKAQIRMCGNSVCPPVAEALVRANCPELVKKTRAERWRPTFAEYLERRAA